MQITVVVVSICNDLSDPLFGGVGLVGVKSRANAFFWPNLSFVLSPILSLLSIHGLVVVGWGLRTDRVFSLSPSLALFSNF